MSEKLYQTIAINVQDKEDARKLCEILAMSGYMTRAINNENSFRGRWIVFVEIMESEE